MLIQQLELRQSSRLNLPAFYKRINPKSQTKTLPRPRQMPPENPAVAEIPADQIRPKLLKSHDLLAGIASAIPLCVTQTNDKEI
ncbi:hypothetical protein AZI85_11190 [Bdellovibrio bacteriovorus]|uniref:Uncharacterized protein n=1 Tax=Bdellovibrio bacteriovorus TaxID=959 RepID=A0A150WCE1_BDEBC|nr:hypothetical protein AZI85_11190 [Bdellovibrio bacteriovorus]